jgi:toxin ParE1/3/4
VSEVLWSQHALDDLDAVFAYIAADNPIAARRVADRIGTTAERLGKIPIGRPGRVAGTYEKPVIGLPYIIAYAVQHLPTGGEFIAVLRVIHTARNGPKGRWPK